MFWGACSPVLEGNCKTQPSINSTIKRINALQLAAHTSDHLSVTAGTFPKAPAPNWALPRRSLQQTDQRFWVKRGYKELLPARMTLPEQRGIPAGICTTRPGSGIQKEEIENVWPSKSRYDFVILFDVGERQAQRRPRRRQYARIDPESGYGIVTDVCLKRKIRNYGDGQRDTWVSHLYLRIKGPLSPQRQLGR